MQLVKEGTKWILKGSRYPDRHIPSSAQFRWDPQTRTWWTDQVERAAKLVAYAIPEVKAELAEIAEEQEASRVLSRATNADVEIPVPEGLEYLPYQKAGIAYGSSRPNVLIADEMGLGKTVEAIGVINTDPSIKTALIITPGSLRINWAREVEKWLVRPYSVGVVRDGNTFPDTDIVIINYDRLKQHRKAIRARDWDLYICDEAHYLKNSKTQRTKEVFGAWDRKKNGWEITPIAARRKVMLTGTPILNRPVELWNLLHALDKKRWSNFMYFAKRYCNATHNGFGWDFSGANEETLPELQRILRETIMVRRRKNDVLKELPPKRRQVIELPGDGMAQLISAESKAWRPHEDRIANLQAKVAAAKAVGEDEYKAAVAELDSRIEIAFEETSQVRHKTVTAKIPHVVTHVKETLESVDKVLVFAQHHDVVDALAEHFGDTAVQVTGKITSVDERQAAVDRFQGDPTCRVFIGTIGAAGVGLTLTAASVVIFAELDWSPGRISQAEDRAHRIGQKNSVLIQHLVIDGSIDAKMAHMLIAKQAIIDKALDGEEGVPSGDAEALVTGNEPVVTSVSPKAPAEPHKEDPRKDETPRQRQIAKEAAEMTPVQIQAVHEALRYLAGNDWDYAREHNGVGFNKFDGRIGHELAQRESLTPRQAALGRRIIKKYHRQLGWDVLERTGVTKK